MSVAGEPAYPTLIDDYEKAMEAAAKKILTPVREVRFSTVLWSECAPKALLNDRT